MKIFLAAAFVITLFSSFITPAPKTANTDCRFFQDTEFTFTCSDTECENITASVAGFTMTTDAESMEFIKSAQGKEIMDKMFHEILTECLKNEMKEIGIGK